MAEFTIDPPETGFTHLRIDFNKIAVRRYIIYVLLYTLGTNVCCQTDNKPQNVFENKNSVQIECFGNGFLYSVNYERVLANRERFKTTAQLGYSMLGMGGQMLPLALTEVISFNKNHIELGLGYTYADYLSGRVTGRIGYRYQNPGGHLVLRIAFMPWYERVLDINTSKIEAGIKPWGGIAVGYSF